MNKLDPRNIYDDLHQIPELGFEEFKTSAYLADKLEAMGYKVTRNIGGTGVIGEIKGSEPGPVMMLRADMDALPFLIDGEKNNIHACGHDAHSAMLLAAASELVGKVKRGTLRILFQQGEETLKGALAVIDAGVIEDVDIALGLHIRPVQDIAYGEMSPAVRHASSTFVNVVINGLSSHGARPHLGVNAIEAAAVAINAITAIKINPIIPWSCKVTGIKGGGVAPNIIPDKVEMIVDARAQTNEAMTELLEKLRRAVTNAAAALGATAEVTTPGGVIPAAEYDDELTAEVAECIVEVVGEEKLAKELVNPGGEDFHYFVNKYPHIKAAYFGVGAAAAPGLHHQDMQLNKEALPSGTAVLVKMVERKLG